MDLHLAMERATGLRSARAGSEVGVEWLATGEYDEIAIAVPSRWRLSGLFFVTSFFLFFLSFYSESFFDDFFLHFGSRILVRYNTFVEVQY